MANVHNFFEICANLCKSNRQGLEQPAEESVSRICMGVRALAQEAGLRFVRECS